MSICKSAGYSRVPHRAKMSKKLKWFVLSQDVSKPREFIRFGSKVVFLDKKKADLVIFSISQFSQFNGKYHVYDSALAHELEL